MAKRTQIRLDADVYQVLERLRLMYELCAAADAKRGRKADWSEILRPVLEAHGVLRAPRSEEEKRRYVRMMRVISVNRAVEEGDELPSPVEALHELARLQGLGLSLPSRPRRGTAVKPDRDAAKRASQAGLDAARTLQRPL